jgi:sugar phosphate permease
MSNETPSGQRTPSAKPTHVRHWVVFAAMLMSVLLYLDRFCVSMAEPYIKQDLGLSTFQIGLFFSAFFLTYALFQIPSGWLTDRYGSRIMLVVYVLTWSFFTAMMGLSYGFGMLILMRAAYGIGQAGAYPTSASILSKWIPIANRGTASSIVALGGRVGGAIAPVLTAFLIVLAVPVSQSSDFADSDLLDAPKLCSLLVPQYESKSGTLAKELSDARKKRLAIERIWRLLPAESQQVIATTAERYRPVEPRIAAFEKSGKKFQQQWRFMSSSEQFKKADALRIKVNTEDRRTIIKGLNDVVHGTELNSADVFDGLKLEKGAVWLRKRVDAGESLSSDERQRLHRLLAEAVFPVTLGKVYVSGWRPVIVGYGLLGLIVAGVLWRVLRVRPSEHPRCNAAEIALIDEGRSTSTAATDGPSQKVPWRGILTSRSLWFNSISQINTNIGWIFIVTWFPRYLLEIHDVPFIERSWMVFVPLTAGIVGMLCGGKLTDWLVPRIGLKWGRRLPWGGSRFIGMTAFLICPFLGTPWAVTIALGVVAISTDLGTAAGWAFCQDVGGKNVGSVLGWGNMWGNLGAAGAPILHALIIDSYGYDYVFYLCGGAFLLAALCGLNIDATLPIAAGDEEDELSS